MVSIVILLAGIGAIVWYYAKQYASGATKWCRKRVSPLPT